MAQIGIDPAVSKARAERAVAGRLGDPLRIEKARQELAVANLACYIKRVVDEAPPLTREQLDSLAVLFRGAA